MRLEILKEILGSCQKESENQYLFYCPKCFHHKKKLAVNIKKNMFKCWICDYRGTSLLNLVQHYGTKEQYYIWINKTGEKDLLEKRNNIKELLLNEGKLPEEKETFLNLPKEYRSLIGSKEKSSSHFAIQYLKNRNIKDEDISKWKIGYAISGSYEDRIIVPSFMLDGRVNYFVARTYNNDWKKYLNPKMEKDVIFNELYLDFKKPIILVEGIFDAIKAGENSVPILGSSIRNTSKLFQQIVKNDTSVYIALDKDAKDKENKIINDLLLYDVKIYKINIEPYNDVGEMTKEEFENRKRQANQISPIEMLRDKIKMV